jgi:tetratricopeptide (TPR) repeat protein
MSEKTGLWQRCVWTVAAATFGIAARASGVIPCRLDEAQSMLEAHRTAEARMLFEECSQSGAVLPSAAFALGRFYLSQGNEERAVHWFERAAVVDPGNSDVQLWLGRAYGAAALRASVVRQPGLAKKVEHAFERAVELDADNIGARLSLVEYDLQAPGFLGGSMKKALAQADEIRRRDRLRGHRAFGLIAEHKKDFAAAAEEYAAAMREAPDAPEPLHWAVDLAVRRGDYPAAFALLQTLANGHGETEALYEIGELAAHSGRELEDGVASLKRYLAHHPSWEEPSLARAHLQLGAIYDRRRERDLARQEYSAALELDPMLTPARQALAKR